MARVLLERKVDSVNDAWAILGSDITFACAGVYGLEGVFPRLQNQRVCNLHLVNTREEVPAGHPFVEVAARNDPGYIQIESQVRAVFLVVWEFVLRMPRSSGFAWVEIPMQNDPNLWPWDPKLQLPGPG